MKKKKTAPSRSKKYLTRYAAPLPSLLPGLAFVLLLGFPVLCPGAAHAEDIVWHGASDPATTPSGTALQPDPISSLGNSLRPVSSRNDNTIKVWANVPGRVLGGVDPSGSTTVSGNTVTIESGTIGGVIGGYSRLGTASDNTVIVKGGTFSHSLETVAVGGWSTSGTAENNTVTISDGTMDSAIGGISNTSGSLATNNIVTIGGNAVVKVATGGLGNSGSATSNAAFIRGGTTEVVYGGRVSGMETAEYNIVSIESGTITGNASSGKAVVGGESGFAAASGNNVLISGGSITGGVYGGFSASGNAENNTVTISGSPDLTGAGIFGGKGNGLRGNTLNLDTPITVSHLGGFQRYNFYLPATASADSTMITVTDGGEGGSVPVKLAGSVAHVGVEGGATPLASGDAIVLIKETGGNGIQGAPTNTTTSGEGMQGITTKLTFDLSTTADSLIATVTGSSTNEQLKALSESREAGLGMINQGADMLTMQGISQLRVSSQREDGTARTGFVPFDVMGGQALRYNSGSHVDVEGFNLTTGLGWNFPLGVSGSENDGGNSGNSGNLLLGAFFEAGWGSYDSHNSFGNAASVKGDGDTSYYGGGILSRYDSPLVGPGNIYAEASARAGRVKTDFDSSDFDSASGNKVGFDSSAAYYGAHVGLGYVWDITEASKLDVYTKYLWTRQDGDSVKIEGDSIRFKAMNSHRSRTGARYTYNTVFQNGVTVSPYIGAAFEYEFDSKAKATANGAAIDAPDVKGATGIGEVGLTLKPNSNSGFSVNFGMQGYTGKREGIGGNLQMKFEF